MKKGLKALVLILVGTLIGLGAAEAAVRLFFPSRAAMVQLNRYMESERGKFTRYDTLLGWDGLKGASGNFEWVDCRHRVKQNRYGYRGPEYPHERTEKTRVVVLGDSFVWGFGVEDEEIFTSVMEKRAAGSLEVVNMGVSGYDNGQEVLLWRKKGRLFHPDEVILMVTPFTDFFENWHPMSHGYPKPVFRMAQGGKVVVGNVPVPKKKGGWSAARREADPGGSGLLRTLFSRSAFLGVLATALSKNEPARRWLVSRGIIPERMPGYEWEYPLYMTSPDPRTENGWRLMFRLLGMLDSSVKREGAKLRVAVVPSIIQVYPELWRRFLDYPKVPKDVRLAPDAPNTRISDWCEENGIEVIDLLGSLRRESRENPYLYYPKNRHWTRDGHEVVADTVLNALGS